MEPIINSQLPEFKVQAFQNGSFKTVTNEDVKGKWAIFFFYPADFIAHRTAVLQPGSAGRAAWPCTGPGDRRSRGRWHPLPRRRSGLV